MGELAEEQRALESMPGWVPDYLAAWGSRFDPDGKRMRVKTAASLAGTTEGNVRSLRSRNPRFRMLEWIAREGGSLFLSSYMDAGIRTMAPELLAAFRDLIKDRNVTVVLQGMKWAMGKADAVDVHLRGVVATDDVSGLSDEELDQRLALLLESAREATTLEAPDGEEETAGADGD